jgi:hypothetical protein
MDDNPFFTPDGYCNWLHNTAAGGGTVAGLYIQMDAAQAPRIVIAVFRAWCRGADATPAVPAGELLFFIVFIVHKKTSIQSRVGKNTATITLAARGVFNAKIYDTEKQKPLPERAVSFKAKIDKTG